jgi:16S rRNA (guanine1516-N2)-methyltransferase
VSESNPCIGLWHNDRAVSRYAHALAERYCLALLKRAPGNGWYLCLTTSGLELREAGTGTPGPVRVDFVGGTLGHRRRFGGGRGQPLARAVGMKPGFNPVIWDATAGLGRDAFVLASLGSRVTLCERSPLLAALLDDGLQRAALDAEIGGWVGERMDLVVGDAALLLAALDPGQRPDVVYVDPMYPPGKSSVLVKKEMRALQRLLGADTDSAQLLDSALRVAGRRVVVKRPGHAGWVGGKKPDTAIESKKTRYDVYVTL